MALLDPTKNEAIAMVSGVLDLAKLPLIIAGPILRRTEPESVSVWLVLQAPCSLELRVMVANEGDFIAGSVILRGSGQTIALGQAVHVVVLTAHPIGQGQLMPGQLYAYDIQITRHDSPASAIGLRQALRSSALPEVCVSYFTHGLPTFSLPPAHLKHLRLFHGSCRKPRRQTAHRLPIIDLVIAEFADCPNSRPHQLFLTGDQIYGDEVADPLLWAIQHLRSLLFGWEEPLLELVSEASPAQLRVGKRHKLAESHAGLTAGLQGDKHKAQNHLLYFSEYCTSYLFAWSDCLWQMPFPSAGQMGLVGKSARRWNQQVDCLKNTVKTQALVRRVFANIATYMIFDDHDVSDDWNLNQDWCLRVLGQPLGRQVVQNALLSYALFQGWGNTPAQFFANTIGADLLTATERWCQSGGQDKQAQTIIQTAIGMPTIDPLTDLPEFQEDGDVLTLKRPPSSLQWHYWIAGPVHDVIVLDTRTQRGYPRDSATDAVPQLLSPSAFESQLRTLLPSTPNQGTACERLTCVVAPTNVFSLEILDQVQQLGKRLNKTYAMDIGDSWTLESTARLQLMQELFRDRRQVIVLSGDIHFGAALRVEYWQQPGITARTFVRDGWHAQPAPDACLVQLVASALCKSEILTELLQTKIKSLWPERQRYWIGYVHEQQEVEVTPGFWRSLTQSVSLLNPQQRQRSQQPIDWGYRSHWIHRQPAQVVPWKRVSHPLHQLLYQQPSLSFLKRLWYSRWVQEGKELVGFNNIGLVQFDQCETPNSALIVLYDLYWYAPWNKPHVVYSRFETSL